MKWVPAATHNIPRTTTHNSPRHDIRSLRALAAERRESASREALAETARAAAQSESSRVTREAEDARMKAESEADGLKRDNDARTAAAALEADRLRLANESRAAAAAAETDRLKRENELQKAANLAAKEKARVEAEKAELRNELLKQFNAILQTRDTARGLIVNMSDVLFDTGKHSLRPVAREKLAKVAGIVSGHLGLRLDVEGHTDSVRGRPGPRFRLPSYFWAINFRC